MAVIDIGGVMLPDGWTAETWAADEICIVAPDVGGVTVSPSKRVYSPGFGLSFSRHLLSTKVYRGRGWRAALFADAIALLLKVRAERLGAKVPK